MIQNLKYILLLSFIPIFGTVEYLDSTFGANFNGIVTTNIGSNSKINAITRSTDGKIIAAGIATINNVQNLVLAKYNSDGSLDSTFGTNGIVNTLVDSETAANAVTVDSNNNIVVAGYHNNGKNNILIVRYTPNGQLDLTFGVGGKVSKLVGTTTIANGITIDLNGKILVVGTAVVSGKNNLVVTRFLTNGNIDTTFGTNGVKTLVASSGYIGNDIEIDINSKIVAVGVAQLTGDKSNLLIVKLTLNGSNDATFGSNGVVTTNIPTHLYSGLKSLVVDPSGKYVVSGYAGTSTINTHFLTARYNLNGTLDTNFGSNLNGIQITSVGNNSLANSIILDLNNQIVAAGFSDYSAMVARFNSANGSLDSSFGLGGILQTSVNNITGINNLAIQTSDGRILAGGFNVDVNNKSTFTLMRFNKNNSDFINITSITDKNINTKTPDIAGISNIPNAQVQLIVNGTLHNTVSTDNFGNWNAGATNLLPIGSNVIRVNLVVSNNIIVSQAIQLNVSDNFGEDSVFIYNTSAQTSTLSNYIALPFNNLTRLGTWTSNNSTSFTCNKKGTYLIEYAGNAGITGTIPAETNFINISTMISIDGIEYLGSESNTTIDLNSNFTKPLTRSFLKDLNAGQTISYKLAVNIDGSTTGFNAGLIQNPNSTGVQPTYSLSISRIS